MIKVSALIDGLYMKKIAKESEGKPKHKMLEKIWPKAEEGKYYNPLQEIGVKGSIAGLLAYAARKGVTGKKMTEFLARQESMPMKTPELAKLMQDSVNKVRGSMHTVTSPAIYSTIVASNVLNKAMDHNADVVNKKASELIDELYKEANMIIPSKEEAEAEGEIVEKEEPQKPKKKRTSKPQKITCENCDYVGELNDFGQCPQCGAIGGVVSSVETTDTQYNRAKDPDQPESGVDVFTANEQGKLEEVISP